MARLGELRLEPLPGTTIGFPGERAIRVCESSVRRADTDEALLTIVSGGFGMRLTKAQVDELLEFLGEWRACHPA